MLLQRLWIVSLYPIWYSYLILYLLKFCLYSNKEIVKRAHPCPYCLRTQEVKIYLDPEQCEEDRVFNFLVSLTPVIEHYKMNL